MSADLDILLADYQSVREDDRGISSRQSALASVFVALLAGLFAILVGDCRFRGAVMNAAKQAGSCYELPDPVYVMAPTLPFAVLCYIVMLGMQVTIKSFYMRAIENELRDHQAELRAIPGCWPARRRNSCSRSSVRDGVAAPTSSCCSSSR